MDLVRFYLFWLRHKLVYLKYALSVDPRYSDCRVCLFSERHDPFWHLFGDLAHRNIQKVQVTEQVASWGNESKLSKENYKAMPRGELSLLDDSPPLIPKKLCAQSVSHKWS